MLITKGEATLYGIDNISIELDNIIETFNLKDQQFEIKLIMSEAVSNAFIHGNKSDKDKPIAVKWEVKGKILSIVVTDCGAESKNLSICKEISDDNILEESGRGLFLINSYSDEVEFDGNSIIMKKYLM